MGAAGAAVDDADGVVGEQSVGSADVGQVRPHVPVGLGRGEVCHEWAARIAVQGLDGRVFPIHADARAAVRERPPRRRVSYGAYHYSGTRDVYIGYYSRFVKPGGVVGFVVPDMSAELDTLPPPELAVHRTRDTWDMRAFHSPVWVAAGLENSAWSPWSSRTCCPSAMMTSSSGSPLLARTRAPSRKPSCCTRTPSGIWTSPVATRRKPGNG